MKDASSGPRPLIGSLRPGPELIETRPKRPPNCSHSRTVFDLCETAHLNNLNDPSTSRCHSMVEQVPTTAYHRQHWETTVNPTALLPSTPPTSTPHRSFGLVWCLPDVRFTQCLELQSSISTELGVEAWVCPNVLNQLVGKMQAGGYYKHNKALLSG
jgi:hypothetical protein